MIDKWIDKWGQVINGVSHHFLRITLKIFFTKILLQHQSLILPFNNSCNSFLSLHKEISSFFKFADISSLSHSSQCFIPTVLSINPISFSHPFIQHFSFIFLSYYHHPGLFIPVIGSKKSFLKADYFKSCLL